jgi:hypothetical protein
LLTKAPIQIRFIAKVPAKTSATRKLNHFCTGSEIDLNDGALVAVPGIIENT